MASIYRIHVCIRGVWGAIAPQKPTTYYKNQIKWRHFLYSEPGYSFLLFFRPGQVIFFYSLQRQVIFFYSLQSQVIFFLQNQRQEIFLENNPGPPPPEYQMVGPLDQRNYVCTLFIFDDYLGKSFLFCSSIQDTCACPEGGGGGGSGV